MAVLGAMFRRARSWLAWMLAGLLLAGVTCLLFPDLLSFRLLAVALLVTGIVCGVICRAFARWPEDADAAAAPLRGEQRLARRSAGVALGGDRANGAMVSAPTRRRDNARQPLGGRAGLILDQA